MTQDPETARTLGLVHGQVCYLQLPAADRNRAAAFYRAVFGWQTETHQILEPPVPDGPTRILATIADSEGNPIGLAGHAPPR